MYVQANFRKKRSNGFVICGLHEHKWLWKFFGWELSLVMRLVLFSWEKIALKRQAVIQSY